uniref:Uncharacterized protein n=1 Tax=Rhizophora mucronata TaxID=61149 RepID=A0A2P2QCC4_RHIMU
MQKLQHGSVLLDIIYKNEIGKLNKS